MVGEAVHVDGLGGAVVVVNDGFSGGMFMDVKLNFYDTN